MLKEFNWIIPTEVIFGEGREEEIGQVLQRYGAKNVLIIIGKNSVIKSGLLNRVIKSIEKENITYEILSGVRANPTFELVKQGKEIVLEKGIDFLLPIGGGSVIDTAKCIAVNAYHDGAISDFNTKYENDSDYYSHRNDQQFTKLHFAAKIDDVKSIRNKTQIQTAEYFIKFSFNGDHYRRISFV